MDWTWVAVIFMVCATLVALSWLGRQSRGLERREPTRDQPLWRYERTERTEEGPKA